MKEKHSNIAEAFPSREFNGIHNSRNSESHSNSYSSSSFVTHFCSNPKNVSKIPDKPLDVSSKCGNSRSRSRSRSKASKENDFPTAASRKLQNKNRSNSLLCRQQSGKTPTSKPVSRSHHTSTCLKKSSSGTQGCRKDHLNNKNAILKGDDKRSTPLALGSVKTDSASKSTSDAVESEDSFSGEKTPPIEASVSPEIQNGTACKGPVVSAATPVCYGAGHLLSGIRDKRKCRPRGLLIIGEEETDLSGGFRKTEDDQIFPKSRPSFVPPPAEASMRWLLSPNDEVGRTSSPTLKNSCQVLSSERFSSFQGFSVSSDGDGDGDGDGDLLSPSSHKSFSSSSFNVVQTPTSDLSSEKAVCCADSKLDDLKLDLEADIPGEASISPNLHCNKLQECASWVSDSTTLASMSLSRMRISWREGSQSFNTEDELDCYVCLSDEKNDCNKAANMCSPPPTTGLDYVAVEKQKPTLFKRKEMSFEAGLLDISAESICIDGASLAASGDSDWTRSDAFLFR